MLRPILHPRQTLTPGPLRWGKILTASGEQIIHNHYLLPWLQGVPLDLQLSLQMKAGT